jgi:exodeoxyribonuclease VII large subunit
MSFMGQPPAARPLSVAQVNQKARDLLESSFRDVAVVGEISRVTAQASGHIYFVLKDAEASVPCALFAREARQCATRPAEGMRVVLRGKLTVWPAQGRFQIVVHSLVPEGEGDVRRAFLALKEKLDREGLTSPERKRPLPWLPRCVGVVTSPTGAAIEDIKQSIWGRFPSMGLLLAPARVQGQGAADELRLALGRLASSGRVDVIILGRGGGSVEDLWAFNDEALVRAVAACPVPVVSAVGHEIDVTLCDLVADVRALTPTEGGVKVVPLLAEIQGELMEVERRLPRALLRQQRELAQQVDHLHQRLQAGCAQSVAEHGKLLARWAERLLQSAPAVGLRRTRSEVQSLQARLAAAVHQRLKTAQLRLSRDGSSLEALNPLAILDRGYSLTRRSDGSLVRRAADAPPGTALETLLAGGEKVHSHVDPNSPC